MTKVKDVTEIKEETTKPTGTTETKTKTKLVDDGTKEETTEVEKTEEKPQPPKRTRTRKPKTNALENTQSVIETVEEPLVKKKRAPRKKKEPEESVVVKTDNDNSWLWALGALVLGVVAIMIFKSMNK